jgi:hypothetical protein
MTRLARTAASLVLLLAAALAAALPLSVTGAGYTLDLPEGWRMVVGPGGSVQSFVDPTESAVLQVYSFDYGSFASSEEMAQVIGDKLHAEGEATPYLYSGRDATLGEVFFTTQSTRARGYAVFVRGARAGERDHALIAYAPETRYKAQHDALLSALDSFCPDPALSRAPGPVAQFASRFPAERPDSRTLSVGGRPIPLRTNADEIAAGQDFVEREARILAAEKKAFAPAWQRYFRLIYRDNFLRATSVGDELRAALNGQSARVQAETLLAWIQGFRYVRTGTLSDLTSPLACLADASGDCDSRALLYVILLHHVGVDAVLLVSTRYQHSAVGVGVDGPGARVAVDGRPYVFAEVTDKVALGRVAADQSDARAWIGVDLGRPPAKTAAR